MTTRAEEIAGEWYPDTTGPDGEIIYMEGQRQVFVNGYKQGQQDRWIPVSQFEAPAPGTIILFGSKATVRMWTWDANNDEPPSSWATHFQLISAPNPEQR